MWGSRHWRIFFLGVLHLLLLSFSVSADASNRKCEDIPLDEAGYDKKLAALDHDLTFHARQICFYRRAIATGNTDDCDRSELDRCYLEVALSKNDFHLCEEAVKKKPRTKSGWLYKKICLQNYAVERHTSEPCHLLNTMKEVANCLAQVKKNVGHEKSK